MHLPFLAPIRAPRVLPRLILVLLGAGSAAGQVDPAGPLEARTPVDADEAADQQHWIRLRAGIYTTAVNSAVEAMRDGAFDFIVKPVSGERLIYTVRNAVERQQLRLRQELVLVQEQVLPRLLVQL